MVRRPIVGVMSCRSRFPTCPTPTTRLRPTCRRRRSKFHHDKHHLAYVNNGNNLLKGTEWEGKSLEDDRARLVRQERRPVQQRRPALQSPAVLEMDEAERRRQDSRRAREGADRFVRLGRQGQRGFDSGRHDPIRLGLGLARGASTARSSPTKTANGESPLVHSGKPILGVDVWEHSYYIDYRNRRPDYLKAFVDHLVNWEYVAELYHAAHRLSARRAAGSSFDEPARPGQRPAARASRGQIDLLVLAKLDALSVGHRAVLEHRVQVEQARLVVGDRARSPSCRRERASDFGRTRLGRSSPRRAPSVRGRNCW